jgi:glucose/mannose transport system permease protein
MALMLSGLKSINSEIWSAARLDGVSFWRLYTEIIIPMMKFTFLTCDILLSLGVVKAYDIVYAMTNGGPGQSTWSRPITRSTPTPRNPTSASPPPPR